MTKTPLHLTMNAEEIFFIKNIYLQKILKWKCESKLLFTKKWAATPLFSQENLNIPHVLNTHFIQVGESTTHHTYHNHLRNVSTFS